MALKTVKELDFFFEPHHLSLAEDVQEFVAKEVEPRAAEDDEEQRTREFIRLLAERGLLGLVVPAAYGGRRLSIDLRSLCLIREGLASSSSLADITFAMQGLGSYPIILAGSEKIKRKYLPPVARGEAIATFALTEPLAGSDAASIKTSAIRRGEAFLLSGEKTLISNAGLADFYTVFASTAPEKGHKGISAFVVEKDFPGFAVTKRLSLLAPHPIGEISFEDCQVPEENLLGQEGEGFRMALATLEAFRITVGAAALGMAQRALDEAMSYTTTREQFGLPLADFQGTRFKLAKMATQLDAARLLVYRAAYKKDRPGGRLPVESAMAKYYATEAAQQIVDQALQLHGGLGVVKGFVVERLYREIRSLRIYEGTSEIQKLIIAQHLLQSSVEA